MREPISFRQVGNIGGVSCHLCRFLVSHFAVYPRIHRLWEGSCPHPAHDAPPKSNRVCRSQTPFHSERMTDQWERRSNQALRARKRKRLELCTQML